MFPARAMGIDILETLAFSQPTNIPLSAFVFKVPNWQMAPASDVI